MKKSGKNKFLIVGIIALIFLIIGVGAFLTIKYLPKQSVLSLSTPTISNDGEMKTYWVWSATANKEGEQYTFTYTPKITKFTNDEDEEVTVTPKQSLSIKVEPMEKKCLYTLTRSNNQLPGAGFTHYLLTSVKRNATLTITDSNGVKKSVNGAEVRQMTFSDSDNKGSLVVETQGLLMASSDCPEYSNIGVILGTNSMEYGIGYETEINSWIDYCDSFFGSIVCALGGKSTPQDAVTFTSGLKELSVSSTQIVGNINFGEVLFTITADSDYFDSTYMTEAPLPEPSINLIVPSSIKSTSSDSGILEVSNNGKSGTVFIEITSDKYGIGTYSSSMSISSGSKKIVPFTITAPSSETSGTITAEVCAGSQFSGEQNCDIVSKTISTTSTAEETCPNEKCDDWETYSTCPSDCESGENEGDGEICQWYQTSYSESSCGFLCSIGLTEPTTKSGCTLNGWLILSGIFFAILFVIIIWIAIKRAINNAINKK